MATIVNRAFGALEKEDVSKFIDIKETEWFYGEIGKAVAMDLLEGDGVRIRPNDDITREEAFTILSRALGLKADSQEKAFKDLNDISTWAKENINGMINAGYVKGANGYINPKRPITRAEFAQLMHNLFKDYIRTPTLHTGLKEGNVMVNVPNSILKDMTIKGDLIIGEGVGVEDIVLEDVIVEGKIIVRSGDGSSILIKGKSDIKRILNLKKKNTIRISSQEEIDLLTIEGSSDVILEGNFRNLQVESSDIRVFANDTKIRSIEIKGKNTKLIADKDSNIKQVNISGQNVGVEGNGKVEEVNVKSGGDNAKISTPETEINVDKNVKNVRGTGDIEIPWSKTYVNGKTDKEDAKAKEEKKRTSASSSTTPAAIEYTVSYSVSGNGGRLESATTSGAIVVSGTRVELTAIPYDGYEVKEWLVDGLVTGVSSNTFSKRINKDTEIKVKFKEIDVSINNYTVIFNSNGGTTVAAIEVKENATITLPEEPTKEGYIFKGWFTETEFIIKVTSETIVTNNLVLHAKWEEKNTDFVGGTGTESDPYQIANAEQLNKVRDYLDAHFIQTEDINLGVSPWNEGEGWEPIGDNENPFAGTYNGNTKTISQLVIIRPDDDCIGLFREIGLSSKIENINIEGFIIEGKREVGALVGNNKGRIFNVSINGLSTSSIKGNGDIGGLCGINHGTIEEASTKNISNISTTSNQGFHTGGLVGRSYQLYNYDTYEIIQQASVKNSYVDNVRIIGGSYTAGLIGDSQSDIPIENCWSNAIVEGTHRVGGLVGMNEGDVYKSYSLGIVTGTDENNGLIGGFIGYHLGNDSLIKESYSLADVVGTLEVGGLVGRASSDVINSYSRGNVSGQRRVGGLIGNLDSSALVKNSYSSGMVEGNTDVGGLIGKKDNSAYSVPPTVEKCYWDTQTSGQLNSSGGTGKTRNEMTQKSTFANWDFDNTWSIEEGTSYPYLKNNEQIPHPQPPIG